MHRMWTEIQEYLSIIQTQEGRTCRGRGRDLKATIDPYFSVNSKRPALENPVVGLSILNRVFWSRGLR